MYQANKIRAKVDYIVKDNLAYIPVPKCMSSQMREILLPMGWKITQATEAEHLFGIIRDPIDRWISGLAETYYAYPEHVERIRSSISDYLVDPWHDPHTSPQVWYYEKTNIELFRIDQLDDLKLWLEEKGLTIQLPSYENTPKNLEKEKLKDIIKSSLKERHFKILRDYYSEGYNLYRSSDRTK